MKFQFKKTKKQVLKEIIFGLISAYFIILAALYIFQDKLIFYPQKISSQNLDYINSKKDLIQSVTLNTKDNVQIKGWYIPSKTNPNANILIYFGGNAEELSDDINDFSKYKDWSVVLINYRGYGESEGNPNEKNLFKDALLVYDHFINENNKPNKTVVMGRSIGSGVAVYLAQNRKVDGVILVTPYDSITSVAKEKFPSIIPVGLLLKENFNSIDRAKDINKPALILIASEDKLITNPHSENLANAWNGNVTKKTIKGADHISIGLYPEYWNSINLFLQNSYK